MSRLTLMTLNWVTISWERKRLNSSDRLQTLSVAVAAMAETQAVITSASRVILTLMLMAFSSVPPASAPPLRSVTQLSLADYNFHPYAHGKLQEFDGRQGLNRLGYANR